MSSINNDSNPLFINSKRLVKNVPIKERLNNALNNERTEPLTISGVDPEVILLGDINPSLLLRVNNIKMVAPSDPILDESIGNGGDNPVEEQFGDNPIDSPASVPVNGGDDSSVLKAERQKEIETFLDSYILGLDVNGDTTYVDKFNELIKDIVSSYIEKGEPTNYKEQIIDIFEDIMAEIEIITNLPTPQTQQAPPIISIDIEFTNEYPEEYQKIYNTLKNSFDKLAELFEKLGVYDADSFCSKIASTINYVIDNAKHMGTYPTIAANDLETTLLNGELPEDFKTLLNRVIDGRDLMSEIYRYLGTRYEGRHRTVRQDLRILENKVINNPDIQQEDDIKQYAIKKHGIGIDCIFENEKAKQLFDFCADDLREIMKNDYRFSLSIEEQNRILIYAWNKAVNECNTNKISGFIDYVGKIMHELLDDYNLFNLVIDGQFDIEKADTTITIQTNGTYSYNDLTDNGKYEYTVIIEQFFTKETNGNYKLKDGFTIEEYINIREFIAKTGGSEYEQEAYQYTTLLAITNWLNNEEWCYDGDITKYYTKYGAENDPQASPNTPWSVKDLIAMSKYGNQPTTASQLKRFYEEIQVKFDKDIENATQAGTDVYQQALNKLIEKFTDGSLYYNTFRSNTLDSRGDVNQVKSISETLLNSIGAGNISCVVEDNKIILSFTFRGGEYRLESPPMYQTSINETSTSRYNINEIGYKQREYSEEQASELCDNDKELFNVSFNVLKGKIINKVFFSENDVKVILKGRMELLSTYFEKVSSSTIGGNTVKTYRIKSPYKLEDVLLNNVYPNDIDSLGQKDNNTMTLGQPVFIDVNGNDISNLPFSDLSQNVFYTMIHDIVLKQLREFRQGNESPMKFIEFLHNMINAQYINVLSESTNPNNRAFDSQKMSVHLHNLRITDRNISFEITASPGKETICVNIPIV